MHLLEPPLIAARRVVARLQRVGEGACHGCLFVAECSCERFNRYLDRALVVPTIGHSEEVAFSSERP